MQKPPGCLGFTPRSESFAIEPLVQVCSISSLSEFRFAEMSCFATLASASSIRPQIRWTFHQGGSAFVGSQTQETLSKTKTTLKVALFCNKKLNLVYDFRNWLLENVA